MKIFKRWQNSSRNGGIHWKSKKDISMVTRKKSKYSGTGSWIFLKMLQCHQLKVRTEGWKRMREIWGEKLWKGHLWMNLSGWSIKGLSGYVEYPFEIFSYKFEMNLIIRVFSLFFLPAMFWCCMWLQHSFVKQDLLEREERMIK